jgi:methyl-accepting chemotaxis protein
MIRMTIGRKIGVVFFVLGLILVFCGVAGYWIEQRLSTTMGIVTGPVWETSRTVTKGIASVQRQLIEVDRILRGEPNAESRLREAEADNRKAYAELQSTGLLDTAELKSLQGQIEAFDAAKQRLLKAHDIEQKSNDAFAANIAAIQDALIEIEKLASQSILEMQMNADDPNYSESGENEARDLISFSTEARLALMSRQYGFQRYHDALEKDRPAIQKQLGTSLEDLRYVVDSMADIPLMETLIGKGEHRDKTHAARLRELVAQHEAALNHAMQSNQAMHNAWNEYRAAAAELEKLGNAIGGKSGQRMEQEVASANEVAVAGGWTLIAVVLAGLLVALGVTLVALKSIARPLREVAEQLFEVTQGDGDLTAKLRVNGNDEVADVARHFNLFTDTLREMVQRLAQSVEQLVQNTNRIKQVSERTGNEVRRQQADLVLVSEEVGSLTANIQEVANDTAGAAQQAVNAELASVEGGKVVEESRSMAQQLSGEVDRATEVIQHLGKESEAISSVLDVIRDISEQTNLLALNAAIEAARAGEHGRGFAVVADEVRQLAARTHQSTNEIRNMIDRLQSGAREAVSVMESSREVSQASLKHSSLTNEALLSIRDAVTNINSLNAHIAEVSSLQSGSAEQVNTNLIRIGEVATATVEDAAELSSVTDEFSRLADELNTLVGQFKVH